MESVSFSDALRSFIVDPAAESDDRHQLGSWLALQRRYAWQPQEIVPALMAGHALEEVVADAGLRPVAGAELERARSTLARVGAVLVPVTSHLYPGRLRRLVDAPPLLAVRGMPAVLAGRAVAIVGARAATSAGRAMAERLGHDLAQAGLVVVSGLARGIDRAAHLGALEAGGFTIAFQACGPDQVYPGAHRELATRIAGLGAVVSELPLGSPPRAPHFPLRNRLISAQAEAVIVVEARIRSGSLVTARHAADQGVDVFAVPGAVTSPTSQGPHQLLREGARIVESADDVLQALGWAPGASAPEGPAKLGGVSGAILQLLAEGPLPRAQLAMGLGMPPQELAAPLLELELQGRIGWDREGRLELLGRSTPSR